MAKRDRRIRTSKAALATPAARPVDQRVALAVEQEGARLAQTTSVPQPKPLPSRYLDGYGGSSQADATAATFGTESFFDADCNPNVDATDQPRRVARPGGPVEEQKDALWHRARALCAAGL